MEKLQVLITQAEGERLARTLRPGTFIVIATTGQVTMTGVFIDYVYRQEEL